MEFERLKESVYELLFQHNCVIIPGFGGFITNFKSAGFEDSRLLICPSRKRVAFNQNLNQNDGLLVNHWSIVNSIPYKTALKEVEDFAIYLHNKINSSKSFDFKYLGTFYQNQEKNLLFLPFQGLNFLESSFGLEPIKIKLLTIIPSGVMLQSVAETTPLNSETGSLIFIEKKNKTRFFPKLMKYAAVITFLFFTIFTLIYLSEKYGKKPLAHNTETEQNASLVIKDTNLNTEIDRSENELIIPEFAVEREKLVEIKSKLSQLSNSSQGNRQNFRVISGYYETESEANLNFKKLAGKFEHIEIKVNIDGSYYILIETFFKHTTAQDFSVMLEQMGIKDTKVEPENL